MADIISMIDGDMLCIFGFHDISNLSAIYGKSLFLNSPIFGLCKIFNVEMHCRGNESA